MNYHCRKHESEKPEKIIQNEHLEVLYNSDIDLSYAVCTNQILVVDYIRRKAFVGPVRPGPEQWR